MMRHREDSTGKTTAAIALRSACLVRKREMDQAELGVCWNPSLADHRARVCGSVAAAAEVKAAVVAVGDRGERRQLKRY